MNDPDMMDNRVGIDCRSGVGQAGKSNGKNWDNCNRTIKKQETIRRKTFPNISLNPYIPNKNKKQTFTVC